MRRRLPLATSRRTRPPAGRATGYTALAILAAVIASLLTTVAAAPPAAAAVGAGGYQPLPAQRLVDTRSGLGVPAPGPVSATGGLVLLAVTGRAGVPTSGIAAVSLTVTAVDPTSDGWVAVWPSGAPRPATSNLNYRAGATVPNLVVTAVGADGRVVLRPGGAGAVHLLVDITGYYTAGSPVVGGGMTPVAPARILDSRSGTGTPAGRVAIGESRDVAVTGRGGIPSGATAVVVNLTAVAPTGTGWMTASPSGQLAPGTSTINTSTGVTAANLAFVKLGPTGRMLLTTGGAPGSVDVLADVVGYVSGSPAGDGGMTPLTPVRVADSRGRSAVAPLTTLTVDVRGAISAAGGNPALTSAVAVNVTVTQPAGGGWITAYPTNTKPPWTSIQNYQPGTTRAVAALVPIAEDGTISIRADGAATHVVVDLTGVVTGAPTASVTWSVETVAGGLTIPWGLAVLPDGALLFAERPGFINLWTPAGVRRVHDLTGWTYREGEAGVMGMELSPAFATDRRFFVCYASLAGDVRVDAWVLAADRGSATFQRTLVAGIPLDTSSSVHAGCRLRIGGDGQLYVSTGDASRGPAPQDLTSLAGKTLRIDPATGAPAAGNPWAGSATPATRLLYTVGHRNPQGLAVEPATGRMFEAEHGPARDDEINILAPGNNHGWNPVGPGGVYDQSRPMTDPGIRGVVPAIWSSGSPTIAPSGATFLHGPAWQSLDGALAVATLKNSALYVLTFPSAGPPMLTRVNELTGYGRLRTVERANNGDLFLTTANGNGTDRIVRVRAS